MKKVTREFNVVKDFFSFYLYGSNEKVNSEHVCWDKFLPSNMMVFGGDKLKSSDCSFTYGSYFCAVSLFLSSNNFELVISAVTQKLGFIVFPKDIEKISIYLEKHGVFYHLSKLLVVVNGEELFFAANVAVSEEGKITIKNEFNALNYLGKKKSLSFLPIVYCEVVTDFFENNQVSMFLAEWFVGFKEFHLSKNLENGKIEMAVWQSSTKNLVLSWLQTGDLYRQITKVLCSYYDPISFKQIFPWHNASGDFIVSENDVDIERVVLRLISVRGFDPMLIGSVDLSEEKILYVLMIFFLHLSIRVRLDRLDGVGDVVLADAMYIKFIVIGFFQGLRYISTENNFSEKFPMFFKKYIENYREKSLLSILVKITNVNYKKRNSEYFIILKNLNEHIFFLKKSLIGLNFVEF